MAVTLGLYLVGSPTFAAKRKPNILVIMSEPKVASRMIIDKKEKTR